MIIECIIAGIRDRSSIILLINSHHTNLYYMLIQSMQHDRQTDAQHSLILLNSCTMIRNKTHLYHQRKGQEMVLQNFTSLSLS